MKIQLKMPDIERRDALKREFTNDMSVDGHDVYIDFSNIDLLALQMFHAGIKHGMDQAMQIVKKAI